MTNIKESLLKEKISTALDIAGKALFGVITFFVYQIYSDFREMKQTITDVAVSVQLQNRDQKYTQKELENFEMQQNLKNEEFQRQLNNVMGNKNKN
jgi:hypothetical protein